MKMYALIMAGGEGKRFWPLSKRDKPKQFLFLVGGRSMIRGTVDRVLPLIPIENVFIVTLERYADETLRHIPEIPQSNLILEPDGKNTAPAIALGMLKIKKLDSDAVTVVLPADHAIGEEGAFRDVLIFGERVANTRLPNGDFPLVTLGIRPVRPETGYGYIKEGEVIEVSEKYRAKRVQRFTEKPDLKTASRFLEEGRYYWNSGIFIWRISTILDAFYRLLPDWYKSFGRIMNDINTPSERMTLIEFYRQIEPGPIDKLILERSQNTVVIPVDFPWSDLGSWQTLDEFLRNNAEENILCGEGVSIDSSGCLVFGGNRPIAIVGVRDLVVVDSGDAILVIDKRKAQDVKKVVEALEKKGK
ncbi:MAG: mannose-1-phosphate guanylyltransferase [Candidatus Dadabacteria bacterium]